jgi:ankyrin repeat protein
VTFPADESLSDAEIAFLLDIMELARAGNGARLAELLDAGVPVNLTNSSGDSLLMLAAYHEHPAVVQLLLDRGADVERVNDRGQTALAAAVFRRSRPIVEALLGAGADPDAGPRSARQVAEFFELDEMASLLPAASGVSEPSADGPDQASPS